MKKITPFFILFCILFPVNSQEKPDIDLVQNNFINISHRLNSQLETYEPMVKEFEQLQVKLKSEIEVYKSCENQFRNELSSIEKWGKKFEITISQSLNSKIAKRTQIENQLFQKYYDFLNWELEYQQKFEQQYSQLENSMGYDSDFMSSLSSHRDKVLSTGEKIKNFFPEYDSCRLECDYCSCDQMFSNFHSNLSIYELYNKNYFYFLNNGEDGDSDFNRDFTTFRESYRKYYIQYLLKYSELKEFSREKLNALNEVSEKLKSDLNQISDIVLMKMERDVLRKHKEDLARIKELEDIIENQFIGIENYNSIIEFQRSVSFMHQSLNPDLNISKQLNELDGFISSKFPENSKARLIQQCCLDYMDNLEHLAAVISTYEDVPYFCFHAYPKYSNDKVDLNLDIINSRIPFEKEGLGHRTQQFVQLTELDLSNSDFSMDLLLKDHKNLKKLDLSNTRINSLEYISSLGLQWLDLSNTEINFEDLQYLRDSYSIQYLDLSNTNLKKMDINELCYHLKVKKKNCIMKKKSGESESSVLVQLTNTSY